MSRSISDRLLEPINTSLVFLLGIYTTFWGVWITFPWWAEFELYSRFGLMAGIMPEAVWGLVAIAVGIVISLGVLKPTYNGLGRSAYLSFFFWKIVMLLQLVSDFRDPSWIAAGVFAVYSGLIWVNLKVNKAYYTKIKQ